MSDKIKKIYYLSSTHWDREWYRDFQGFRFHLVERINEIIDVLERDPSFTTFIMDGQTIVLDDYSEIEPVKKDRLIQLIREGRIVVGPWYTMPDEFLVTGESLIRNLQIGHQLARKYETEAMKYGYICDIFGHIAQLPQILKGFGIEGALLGRGTNYHNCPAHFIWESPDGSRCITFKVPEETGYATFWSDVYLDYLLGKDREKENLISRACQYVDKELKRSDIPYVVLMDGMDHERIHKEATWIASRLSEIYDCPVVFENMENLVADLKAYVSQMPVKRGELNETAKMQSGHNMLITNTLSSRYDLKRANDECQILLEKWALPMTAVARLKGCDIQSTYTDLAYKLLTQCHAHDSICGCSIDAVHKDMHYRFRQVKSIAKNITDKAVRYELNHNAEDKPSEVSVLSVFNPLPFARRETITVTLDFIQDYPNRFADPSNPEQRNAFKIMDREGREIPYNLVEIKKNSFTEKPGELYRYTADLYTIAFLAELSPMGPTEYMIVPYDKPIRYLNEISTSETSCENEYIRLEINADGTINIKDKETGKEYRNLMSYLDDGEIGDGWFHAGLVKDRVVSSRGSRCVIEKIDDGPAACTFCITHYMRVPKRAVRDIHGFSRSDDTIDLKISSKITLGVGNRWVDVATSIDNVARDHRLRLKLPTGIEGNTYNASQAFCFVEREIGFNRDTGEWKEADLAEKAFESVVLKRDALGDGLAFISGGGLHECAVLDDENYSMIITLFRSFSKTHLTDGEEDGQLQQILNFNYRLMPIRSTDSFADIIRVKDCLQAGIRTVTERVSDTYLPKSNPGAFVLEGDHVVVSLIKTPEDLEKDAVILRCSNYSNNSSNAVLRCPAPVKEAFETDLLENSLLPAAFENDLLHMSFNPWEIKTFRIRF